LRVHNGLNLDHVHSWNSLGDAHNEINLGLDSLKNSISSEWGWDVDDRGFSSSLLLTFGDTSEDWNTEMGGSCLSLVDSSDNLGSVFDGLLRVEGSLNVRS